MLVSDPSSTILSTGSEPPSCYKEDDDKTNGIQEPIYVNVNSRKQTSPVLLSDLHSYILKHKEHSWEGFKREFEVSPEFLKKVKYAVNLMVNMSDDVILRQHHASCLHFPELSLTLDR